MAGPLCRLSRSLYCLWYFVSTVSAVSARSLCRRFVHPPGPRRHSGSARLRSPVLVPAANSVAAGARPARCGPGRGVAPRPRPLVDRSGSAPRCPQASARRPDSTPSPGAMASGAALLPPPPPPPPGPAPTRPRRPRRPWCRAGIPRGAWSAPGPPPPGGSVHRCRPDRPGWRPGGPAPRRGPWSERRRPGRPERPGAPGPTGVGSPQRRIGRWAVRCPPARRAPPMVRAPP